jgi:cytidylate kinase
MLYHVDVEDESRYAIAIDASRLTPARAAEALLAAGGVTSRPAETGSLG